MTRAYGPTYCAFTSSCVVDWGLLERSPLSLLGLALVQPPDVIPTPPALPLGNILEELVSVERE